MGVPSVPHRDGGSMNDNEEFVREFLVESAENLDQLDQDLVALEENPRDSQRLASIFRTVHTIKGTSGFFGFAKLGAITHSGEHLLGQLRDGKIDLDNDVTGVDVRLHRHAADGEVVHRTTHLHRGKRQEGDDEAEPADDSDDCS